jgi:hypothetical protein
VYQNDKNEYGCPLHEQSGRVGVRDFDMIVARLSPELRAAFESERAARRAELKRLRSPRRFTRRPRTRRGFSRAERALAALRRGEWIRCFQGR